MNSPTASIPKIGVLPRTALVAQGPYAHGDAVVYLNQALSHAEALSPAPQAVARLQEFLGDCLNGITKERKLHAFVDILWTWA
jgi:hypothetical protein